MGTGFFLEVKRAGRGAGHPASSKDAVANESELYFRLPPVSA